MRPVDHASLVIILSTGGSPLDGATLDALGGVEVTWVRVECEGEAACLAARVRLWIGGRISDCDSGMGGPGMGSHGCARPVASLK